MRIGVAISSSRSRAGPNTQSRSRVLAVSLAKVPPRQIGNVPRQQRREGVQEYAFRGPLGQRRRSESGPVAVSEGLVCEGTLITGMAPGNAGVHTGTTRRRRVNGVPPDLRCERYGHGPPAGFETGATRGATRRCAGLKAATARTGQRSQPSPHFFLVSRMRFAALAGRDAGQRPGEGTLITGMAPGNAGVHTGTTRRRRVNGAPLICSANGADADRLPGSRRQPCRHWRLEPPAALRAAVPV